jgi:predicted O-methyltransferase YrrM
MNKKTASLQGDIHDYMLSIQPPESPQQTALRLHTQSHPYPEMQIPQEQGVLLAWLVRVFNVKTIIELGVFTGYSSLCMAEAVPDDGKIIACDRNAHWVEEAFPFWEAAGIRDKIDLRIGEGLDTFRALLESPIKGTVDMIFIDADKPNYPQYYEQALQLLKPNGILILDNIFLMGRVITDGPEKKTAKAIRKLNLTIKHDKRVTAVVLPIGDGVTLIKKT